MKPIINKILKFLVKVGTQPGNNTYNVDFAQNPDDIYQFQNPEGTAILTIQQGDQIQPSSDSTDQNQGVQIEKRSLKVTEFKKKLNFSMKISNFDWQIGRF